MSKRVPNEERRVSTTFAVSQNTIRKIDELATVKECSRSAVIAHAVEELWKTYFYYIDDSILTEYLEKQKTSSVYGELHNTGEGDDEHNQ